METFSIDFKRSFLFALTKELIRNSVKDEIIELQKIFKPKEREELVIELEEKQEPVFEQSIFSTEKIKEPERPIPIKQIVKKFVTKPVSPLITGLSNPYFCFAPKRLLTL